MSAPSELVLRESDTTELRLSRTPGEQWRLERIETRPGESPRTTAHLLGNSIGVEARGAGCEIWIGSGCLDTFADAFDAVRGFVDAQHAVTPA